MNCPDIQEELSAYLDNELDATARAQVETHLSGCEHCQKKLEDLSVVVQAARNLPKVRMPGDLSTSFKLDAERDALLAPLGSDVRAPGVLGRIFSFRTASMLAAAALLIVVVSVSLNIYTANHFNKQSPAVRTLKKDANTQAVPPEISSQDTEADIEVNENKTALRETVEGAPASVKARADLPIQSAPMFSPHTSSMENKSEEITTEGHADIASAFSDEEVVHSAPGDGAEAMTRAKKAGTFSHEESPGLATTGTEPIPPPDVDNFLAHDPPGAVPDVDHDFKDDVTVDGEEPHQSFAGFATSPDESIPTAIAAGTEESPPRKPVKEEGNLEGMQEAEAPEEAALSEEETAWTDKENESARSTGMEVALANEIPDTEEPGKRDTSSSAASSPEIRIMHAAPLETCLAVQEILKSLDMLFMDTGSQSYPVLVIEPIGGERLRALLSRIAELPESLTDITHLSTEQMDGAQVQRLKIVFIAP